MAEAATCPWLQVLAWRMAELANAIRRHVTASGATAIPNLYLSAVARPTQPLHVAQSPCLALVAQGAKSLTIGRRELVYGVGDFLLVSVDLPVVSRVIRATPASPNLGIGLMIDPELLANVLRRVEPAASPANAGAEVWHAPAALLDAVARLVRLLDTPADVAGLAPLVHEEILYRVLTGPAGGSLLRLARKDDAGSRSIAAARWIRDHLAHELDIARLAGRVGMSVSSLHHHFKASTGLAPLQYQKQLRLNEAKRLLRTEHLDVAGAGERVGYHSASHFSRDYARFHGQSPRRDVSGRD